MTFSQLQKALEQMGVKEIAEVGVEFDPNLHNAIKQMDDTDFEENKVCQIYQKGYLLGDRLIRNRTGNRKNGRSNSSRRNHRNRIC